MAVKYHISPETGRPNICRATTRPCPVGGDHYDSKEAARAGYEGQQSKAMPALKKAKKKQSQLETVSYSVPWSALKAGDRIIVGRNSDRQPAKVLQLGLRGYQVETDGGVTYWESDRTRSFQSHVEKIEEVDLSPSKTYWYDEPLAKKEAAWLEDMRGRINNPSSYSEEDYRRYRTLNTRLHYAGTEDRPRHWPPVPSEAEVENGIYSLEREELHGYSVREILRTRSVDSIAVREAEAAGRLYVDVKVPSYSEVSIPTDYARHALGMKPRPKTKADHTPAAEAMSKVAELREKEQKIWDGPLEERRAIERELKAANARAQALARLERKRREQTRNAS